MKITQFATGPLSVNTYLVLDETTGKGFIVDPGGRSEQLLQQVKEENGQIEAILLTHGHCDHIGGVDDARKEFPQATVIAHEAETAMLADANMNMSPMVYNGPITQKADKTVKDGERMKVGTMELTFLHTPGHSPGGMCILADNVLFSGDTLFCQSIGRTDFPGSSFRELLASIQEKLFPLPDETKVFPGHMGTTEIGAEKNNNPFLQRLQRMGGNKA